MKRVNPKLCVEYLACIISFYKQLIIKVMKKTYDRKFFGKNLYRKKKDRHCGFRLLIILLGFPLLTRAGTSGLSRGEIDLLSGTSRQDSVICDKPGNRN